MIRFFIRLSVLALSCFFFLSSADAQVLSTQNISADLQTDFQYNTDTTRDKAMGMHSYLNAVYRYSGFELGVRYEAYMPPMVGFATGLEGQGIAHRYVSFQHNRVKASAGHFYTQFGNGIVYRSYEARGLGLDNSLDGLKVEYTVPNKVYVVALGGRQRFYFDSFNKFTSIMRGGSADVNVSNFFSQNPKVIVNVGASYLNRYFPRWAEVPIHVDSLGLPLDSIPSNVEAYSGRLSVQYKGFAVGGEVAEKTFDPSQAGFFNDTIKGHCYYFNAGYSRKGFSAIIQYKEVRNFDFAADPTLADPTFRLNYIPPLAKQHTYKLFAKYPYATQYLDEKGFQVDMNYSPKLGTTISVNHTEANSLDTAKYYKETGGELEHKITSSLRGIFGYQYLEMDIKKILFEGSDTDHVVYAHTFALETVYRIYKRHSVRGDFQYLYSKNYKKDWIYGLIEYTWAPKISVSFFDEFNLGLEKKHYFTGAITYIEGNSRFTLSYGKQSEGLVCVGGVCRFVPAFEGITFSLITKL